MDVLIGEASAGQEVNIRNGLWRIYLELKAGMVSGVEVSERSGISVRLERALELML